MVVLSVLLAVGCFGSVRIGLVWFVCCFVLICSAAVCCCVVFFCFCFSVLFLLRDVFVFVSSRFYLFYLLSALCVLLRFYLFCLLSLLFDVGCCVCVCVFF